MKDVLKEEMDMNSKLFSLREEIIHRYETIDALGVMVDMMFGSMAHGNMPTADTLENQRFVLEECFDRERGSLTWIQEELQKLIDSTPAEAETESGDSQCKDVYKAIEEVPVADHEMNRDEIRQIMDKVWKPSQDADGAFNAILDAYNYGFSQGYKTGLNETGVKKCI